MCMDGHTYERKAIEEWLQHNDSAPKTNAKLHSKLLIPNHAVKQAIGAWRKKPPSTTGSTYSAAGA